ncbi:uncharacterized protein LOC126818056 [Patella vulgata]|uniref:uncharacterized protein LOC126818056 n=1 Tax=Patella vulgata TaxID=6465 RepID=UPI00217F7ADD|nr:uncharacterized protein LOC126818056 [Patella vulgata]
MTHDESDDEDKDGENIHLSLKKLKIDPDWDSSSISEHSQCVDIHRIWLGETSNNCKPSPKRPKHRVSPSRRTEPYPADCVVSFERLCLRKEKCNKKWCLCKYDKSKLVSTTFDQKLNYAVAVGSQRKLIHDARLKLHHAQKDHRQIIRAAKLQLNEAKKIKANREHSKKVRDKSMLKSSYPRTIFGSSSKMVAKNFSNVDSVNKLACDSELPDKHEFKGYRAGTSGFCFTSKDGANTSNKPGSSSTDTSPNKVEKSCSQEASIDDLSVDELAGYFDDFVHIPKKMSVMAEMMYT